MTKKIKSLLFAFVFVISIMYGATVGAVPAAGVMLQYSQPSGETFKASIKGDEKANWVVSETGEVIVQDKDKYWKFAEEVNGKIQASKYKYSKSGQKPLEVIKDKDIIIQVKKNPAVISSSQAASLSGSTSQMSQSVTNNSNLSFGSSTQSSEKILVLLVEFSNIKMKYSEADWSNSFFGSTGSTVSSYYREVSNGKFTFVPAAETWGTANDGVIKVNLPYNHPNTGSNTGSANQKIVTDALTAADPYINYASFDTNGDGTISPNELHILTVVAGYEAAYGGGVTPSVWAHSWGMSVTLDGKHMYKYTQEGEVHYDHMATIGTACHELGHDLGLPDLYDTDYSSEGIGIHSLMAGGSWAYSTGYPGSSPTHMDAWCKAQLGYVTPTLAYSGNYTVNSFDTSQYNVLKIPTANQNQYFLIENRELNGFDKGLGNNVKKGGIAIWHVDESIYNNDNESHKHVDLEEANEGVLGYSQLDKNYGGTYNHYYSSSNVSLFAANTIPNSNLYDGTKTSISVSANVPYSSSMVVSINGSGDSVPPQITNMSVDAAPFVPTGSNNATVSYTLSKDANITVKLSDSNNTLLKVIENNVSKVKGNLTVLWDGKDANGQIVRDGGYTITITAVDSGGLSSGPVYQHVTVEKDKPTITNVSDVPDPFTGAVNTTASIRFTISEDVYCTLKLYDTNNNLVRTLVNNQFFSHGVYGQWDVTWDGKDDAGKPCSNGIYTYKINAIDNFNKAADEASGTITIDRGAPVTLTLVGHKPDPFKLNTRITYSIDQTAYIRLNIYDSNGSLVRNLVNNVKRNAGTYYTTWTGRNNSNAAVSGGIYKYTIEAEDLNGNISGPFSGTVTIDREGPIITNLAVSDSIFVPNGGNNSTISYNLSEDGIVTVNIYDNKNNLKKTLLNKVLQSSGANSAKWDGKDKNGSFVPDGTYTAKVSAYDSLDNRSLTYPISIIIDRVAPSIDNVSDTPDPLRVGDGLSSAISYNISENAHVTLKIYDSKNNLVKSLYDADVLAGTQKVLWDGKDSSGNFVANGTYTYKINATDISGKPSNEAIGTITTDKTAIVITNVSINPSTFAPSGVILYTITKDAKVTVKILNSLNQEIRTIENGSQLTAGSHSSSWDGKNNSGVYPASGTYKYQITAIDAVGFNAIPVVGSFTFAAPDLTAPQITNVSDSPDPLKLGAAGAATTINFTLSENAAVTLKIYDSNNNLIKTLINSNLATGDNSTKWDGKNTSDSLVADGTYIYKIDATDASGNVGTEIVGTITTDKTPITITNVSTSPDKFAISGNINYTISKNAKVTITIFDDKNNLVNTIANAVSMNAGSQTTVWNGSDSNGFDAQSGVYTYIITAIDNVGFMATAQGNITVDGPAPVISNLSSNPEPFIATGSNAVTISYTISSNANATLKIYDSNNSLVKTVLNSTPVLRGQNTVNWLGKNESGSLVPDGSYSYKIDAVDAVGKPAVEVSGIITVDKTAPAITNVSVTPNPFGLGSTATISYTLSKNANVSIKILDSSSNVIRTIENSISKNSGVNTVKWDGKDNNGNFVTGNFTYSITAVDAAKFSSTVNGIVTCLDSSTPKITGVSTNPSILNLDGVSTINILYSLSKDAKVILKIYDSNNNLVKVLVNNIQQNKGSSSTWWDGKDSAGTLVEEGIYTYKIDAVDGLGVTATQVTGQISAGASLTITSNKVSIDPFMATGTAVNTISYVLSKKASVTIGIYDSSNNLVKSILSASQNSGSNSVQWDGKNSAGNIVQDGIYTYKIDAVDTIDQKASVTGSFIVVSSSPQISNINVTPNPFKADGSLANINYTLSKNSLVTLEIFDSGSKSVLKLLNNVTASKGANITYWNGKDSSSATVNDGTYTIKITVVDPFSKETVQGTGTITVQKYPPAGTLSNVTITPNPYAPNGGNATISYTLSNVAYITTSIIDSNNKVTKTLQNNIQTNAGSYTLTWDGKDSSGNIASDGIYTLKISALNGGGTGSSATASFVVDRLSPVISNVNDTPDPFKPNGVDLWNLNFNLSEDSNVYIELKNSNGIIVWTARPIIFTKGQRTIQLYGTNDQGQLLGDGVYNYRLWAVDFGGKSSNEVTGILTIDKTAPVISNVIAPKSFNSSATISYKLSEPANVTITISSGNTVIRTLESSISKANGDNSVIWNGKGDNGNIVDDGNYTYTITAVDGVGLSGSVTGTIIKDNGEVPVISNVGNSCDIFEPSGSNYTTISYTISKNAYVSIKIYDNNGKLVKTLVNNYSASKGANSANWDGTDDTNTIVVDGVYTFRINAVDMLGNSAVQVGGTVIIDRTAPVISNFVSNPYPFAPDGINNMTISYNLSEGATVTLEVLDDSNNIITTLEDASPKILGANSTLWDGFVNGIALDDDIYRVRIIATDAIGNSTDYYDYIGIDRFVPQIIEIDDNPDPFNPNVVDFSTIHGQASEWLGTANASLYDKNNNKIKGYDMQDVSEFWWGWSGTDTSGKTVNDGVYTYKVNGADLFGKTAKEASGTVTIDTSIPQISGLIFVPELDHPRGTIKYSISQPASVSIGIYDSSNNLINRLESNVQKNAGSNSVYWDGTTNGNLVGYGVYTYKITAIGSNGANALPAMGVITFETIDLDYIDNTVDDNVGEDTKTGSSQHETSAQNANPLVISGVNVSPGVLLPSNSGSTCTISFNISEDALVTISMYDSNKKVIKTLTNKNYSLGSNSINWDGKDVSGKVVSKGIYSYYITAADKQGNYADPVIGTIDVGAYYNTSGSSNSSSGTSTSTSGNSTSLTISNVTLSPSKFAPSGTITYTLSKEANVTVAIYDRSLNIIRTLEGNTRNIAGTHSISWDGKDSSGYDVDDYVYNYKISAVDLNGVSASPAIGTIAMDITPFTITAVSVSPNPYTVKGSAGGINPMTITYYISVDARISAEIYDSNNKFVKTIAQNVTNTAGNNTISWHGTNTNNVMVSPGTYTIKITAVSNSNKQKQLSINVVVQ